jgi:hypothetical protein
LELLKLNLSMLRPYYLLLIGLAFAALLSAACGVLGGDEEDSSGGSTGSATPGNTGGVRIVQAVMGTDITPERQITRYATRAFPEGTSRVYAVLVMEGVEPGSEVTVRWFQLSADEVEPDGHFVNEAGVTLTDENVNASGQARVALDFGSTEGALPNGDWLVRVYVDGVFVRTMGFVISSFVTLDGEPAGTPPSAAGEPTATPAQQPPQPTPTVEIAPTQQPETYTVVSGDTLTVIAERFKPATETTESYVARLQEANALAPGAILFVGQVLTLPTP